MSKHILSGLLLVCLTSLAYGQNPRVKPHEMPFKSCFPAILPGEAYDEEGQEEVAAIMEVGRLQGPEITGHAVGSLPAVPRLFDLKGNRTTALVGTINQEVQIWHVIAGGEMLVHIGHDWSESNIWPGLAFISTVDTRGHSEGERGHIRLVMRKGIWGYSWYDEQGVFRTVPAYYVYKYKLQLPRPAAK